METLRVAFCDFWPEITQENAFLPILEKHFEVKVTKKNPDVVIHSIFNRKLEAPRFKCKKILFIAENIRYSYDTRTKSKINQALNTTNYTISFDPENEKNYRLPLWQYFILMNPDYKKDLFEEKIIWDKERMDRFCAFVVSNQSNFIRNSAYTSLSSYRRVHSYGRFMTNDLSLQKLSKGKYWRDAKMEYFKKVVHKFMFAMENTSYPWYCTEKIMDAFLVGSIPIYWGDPKIGKDWNQKAFINLQKEGTSWTDKIRKLDQNNGLFNSIYEQPVFTDEQKERHLSNMDEFENWLVSKIKE